MRSRPWVIALVLLLLTGCPASTATGQSCVPAATPSTPAECHQEWEACGTVRGASGDVDCGSCPGGLECGQFEPNVCGGVACTAPDGTSQFIRQLKLAWSPDAGRFESEPVIGLVRFFAPLEDSAVSLSPLRFSNYNRVDGSSTLSGEVMTVDLEFSQGGSGGAGLLLRCTGSVRSSVTSP
ncbi:MAG: hypothetical protein U0228_07455 [Myxococcaceae bacterium]